MFKILRALVLVSSTTILMSCATAPKTEAGESFMHGSYGELAHTEVKRSFEKMRYSLLSPAKDGESTDSLAAINDFHDKLELFVHAFPIDSPHDYFLELRSQLERGAPSDLASIESYIERMHRSKATRRKRSDLSSVYWGRVDYIPDMKGPAEDSLRGFTKALMVSVQADVERVKGFRESRENKSPPGNGPDGLASTQKRLHAILGLRKSYGAYLNNDQSLAANFDTIEEASSRCDAILAGQLAH